MKFENELIVCSKFNEDKLNRYIDEKAECIYSGRNINSDKNENKLILSYPNRYSEKNDFDMFFDSPSIVAHNREFHGLFAIDVSSYVAMPNCREFNLLMKYAKDHKNIVFLFIAELKVFNEKAIENEIGKYIGFKKIKFEEDEILSESPKTFGY